MPVVPGCEGGGGREGGHPGHPGAGGGVNHGAVAGYQGRVVYGWQPRLLHCAEW